MRLSMKKTMSAALVILAVFALGSAHAVLVNNGGGLIYDTDLNITWYDYRYGGLNWSEAVAWAANLNVGGITGWRVSTTPVSLSPELPYSNTVDLGEMGHLYHVEGIRGDAKGLFPISMADIWIPGEIGFFWSGTTGPDYNGQPSAIAFSFSYPNFPSNWGGYGLLWSKENIGLALAVHDGNISPSGVTEADLAGTWYFQVFSDSPSTNAPYWGSGTMILDSTGAVTGGTAINDSGITKTLTGGSFTIDSAGQVAGTITLSDGTSESLPHGKLDAGQTVLTMVNSDQNYRGLFVALKGGGTFTQVDLAGTWYFQNFSDSPSTNAPYWASGTMILDSTGAVTGGTAISDSGITKALTGGSFTIDSAGQVAGTFTVSGGFIESLPHGKLDAGKTVLAMVSSDPNYRGLFVALKGGGTFTQADLAGTWYIQAIADQPLANNPYWASGTMILDSTGAVTGGTAVNSFGETKSFTSGLLTIDSLGQFSGSYLLSDGMVGSIPHGKLDAEKSILTMVVSNLDNRGLFVAAKSGMAGTCSGDINSDGDVDGSDLAALIANTSLIDLTTFAENFGENDCP
jgi:hypothetical protein